MDSRDPVGEGVSVKVGRADPTVLQCRADQDGVGTAAGQRHEFVPIGNTAADGELEISPLSPHATQEIQQACPAAPPDLGQIQE